MPDTLQRFMIAAVTQPPTPAPLLPTKSLSFGKAKIDNPYVTKMLPYPQVCHNKNGLICNFHMQTESEVSAVVKNKMQCIEMYRTVDSSSELQGSTFVIIATISMRLSDKSECTESLVHCKHLIDLIAHLLQTMYMLKCLIFFPGFVSWIHWGVELWFLAWQVLTINNFHFIFCKTLILKMFFVL